MEMNPEVTAFLNQLNHPLREQIEVLRQIISNAEPALVENIKWNGPNYALQGDDRITLRINPPGSLNLILHLGAKKVSLDRPLIRDETNLLAWKSNDRAFLDIKEPARFHAAQAQLTVIISAWLSAAKRV